MTDGYTIIHLCNIHTIVKQLALAGVTRDEGTLGGSNVYLRLQRQTDSYIDVRTDYPQHSYFMPTSTPYIS